MASNGNDISPVLTLLFLSSQFKSSYDFIRPIWIIYNKFLILRSAYYVMRKSLSCVQLFATPCTIQSMEFSRPEYWSRQLFPSPRDLPNPGIQSRSPGLQVDSLPAKPLEKPKNTGVGRLSLLQWIFLT